MKLRSTTPSSTSLKKRAALLTISLVLAATSGFMLMQPVKADSYDNQIAALQREVDQYQAAANKLGAKADTLQRRLNAIQNDVDSLQAKIKLNEVKHKKLLLQIKETKQQIADNRDALGEVIADLGIEGQVSPLEMLASSKNISDYVDKQAYQESMRDELNATIKRINALKDALEKRKKDVENVLAKQKAQENALAAKRQEQAKLVAETRGQESAYKHLVAASRQRIEDMAAQQRAYYQSLINSGNGGNSGVVGSFSYSNWSGNQGCSGGYPYCGAQDSYADPWDLYNRECVSYVAWALYYRFHKEVNSFQGSGNAMDWPWSAPRYSGAYRVYSPQPGDAVILPASGGFAPIGHAMIVESVSGSTMHVSQFNFYGTGEYSTMDVQNSGVVLLRFRDR